MISCVPKNESWSKTSELPKIKRYCISVGRWMGLNYLTGRVPGPMKYPPRAGYWIAWTAKFLFPWLFFFILSSCFSFIVVGGWGV